MSDWTNIIRTIEPRAKGNIVDGLVSSIHDVIETAELNTPLRLAHFLAQIAHESAGFTTTEEFASGAAYEGRKDLGNVNPGDGKRFKGRGLIQLTGRHNHKLYGDKLGVDLVSNPELAGKFPTAALTAALFWKNLKLNRYADRDDIKSVTRHINGGYNGLSDRERYLSKAKAALSGAYQSLTEKPIWPIPSPPNHQSEASINIAAYQRRLTELNYATGGADGIVGPLTRSAIRDFQDANNLVVNGKFDRQTIALLNNPDTPARPVAPERASMTVKDLREGGSKTIEGSDESKIGAIGTGLATTAAAASSASSIVSSVKEMVAGEEAGVSWIELAKTYWPVFVVIASIAAIAYFAWRAYHGAHIVAKERVENARSGLNVRL